MTVTYTGRVANARLCAFSRLLLCWKGSIYKLMYKEMLIFCVLYTFASLVYRLALSNDQRRVFEKIALYCEKFTDLIPLSFVLGFYVSVVVTRWWNQYMAIPWPDRVMLYITTMVDGADVTSRIIRRTLMRYLTLSSLIVFQATSVRIKKRFPTMDHLVEAGIVTKTEVKMMDEVNTPHGKWWLPFVWSCNLIREARRQGRIADNYLMKTLIDELNMYRGNLGLLYSYDWISVPLVYTQVTTLAVYSFFLGSIFGRQFLDPSVGHHGHDVDLYVPLFTILQFFFYMGWLKVAEQLINPFGEDDDDFEMNWIIDRNMQISWLTADDLYGQIPPLEKDAYFGEPPPDNLPYTKSSVKSMSQPHMGSTADLRISDDGMKILTQLETIQEGVALGHQPAFHRVPSSVMGSPRRAGLLGGGATPIAMTSPLYGPRRGVLLSQNLMSGVISPVGIHSRESRASLRSSALRDGDFDSVAIGNHLQTTSYPAVPTGSSVVNKVTEKLGRWLMHHGSRADDLNLSRSYNSTYIDLLSRQTSTSEDLHANVDAVAFHPVPDAQAMPPTSSSATGPSPWTPTASSVNWPPRPTLPPLSELFSPQSMFVDDDAVSAGTLTATDQQQPAATPVVRRRPDAERTSAVTAVSGPDLTRVVSSRRRPNDASSTWVAAADVDESASIPDIPRRRRPPGGLRLPVGPADGTGSDQTCRPDDGTTTTHGVNLPPAASAVVDGPLRPGDVVRQTSRGVDDGCAAGSCSVGVSRFSTVLVSCSPPTTREWSVADGLGGRPASSDQLSGSTDEYDRPESNQCTVTSMTPLLDDAADDDDEPEVGRRMAPPGGVAAVHESVESTESASIGVGRGSYAMTSVSVPAVSVQ